MAEQGKNIGGIIELIGQNPQILDYLANTTALTGLGGLAAVLRRNGQSDMGVTYGEKQW